MQLECLRCGHKWYPRRFDENGAILPKVCPTCKSPYWHKPRKEERGKEE